VITLNGSAPNATVESNLIFDGNRLGIGTTTPQSRLDLGTNGALSQLSWHNNATTSYGHIGTQVNSAALGIMQGLKFGTAIVSFESSISVNWAKSALLLDFGNIRFFSNPADIVSYGTTYTPTERMRITSAGRVGIGTTSPSTELDVNGIITATGGNSTNWNTSFSDRVTNAVFTSGASFGNRLTLTRSSGNLVTAFTGLSSLDAREAIVAGSDGSNNYMPLPNSTFFNQSLKVLFTQDTPHTSWGSILSVKGWTDNYHNWQLSGPASTGNATDEFYLRTSNATTNTWNPWRTIWHSGNLPSPVGGTIGTGQVAYGIGSNQIGGEGRLTWDSATGVLQIADTAAPTDTNTPLLRISANSTAFLNIEVRPSTVGNSEIRYSATSGGVISGSIAHVFLTRHSFGAVDERWRITSTGIFQSLGSQTIQTSTGNLTLATLAGNGNILLSPHGSGNVLVNTTSALSGGGKLQVNGNAAIQGTLASDSAQLGTELLTAGTGDSSWVGTSFETGYTHIAGSTTTLTSTLAPVINSSYQITYTVTNRTAGSFTISFGGFLGSGITATGAVGPRATTTDTLIITPTSDFNGTIVLSIRLISISSAGVTFNSSTGTITNQIRISNITTNTFVGVNAGRNNTTGCNNTFVGAGAGLQNTTGINNTMLGLNAGICNTIGSSNSSFGVNAGFATTTGSNNVSFGVNAGLCNTTGGGNVFIGVNAGRNNTTANSNTFVGRSAGNCNTTGISNSFVGNDTGFANTTGGSNSFFGASAGLCNTTGNCNSFIGLAAGQCNTAGNSNSFVGVCAGRNNTTGNSNSFVGANAGFANTEGISNSFVGVSAGQCNISGNNNSFFGVCAGFNNTTACSNSFFGVNAGRSNTTGGSNSFFGVNAGICNTTGGSNSFFGVNAGICNTTGVNNSFVGVSAGFANTEGNCNSFFGVSAGQCNTVGNGNSFVGVCAGRNNTTGNSNSFVGAIAGFANTEGISNSFFGVSAGQCNTSGNSNSFFGVCAGFNNTTACNNSFFGVNAGCLNTTGNSNSFVGLNAGRSNTIGNSNSFVGVSAGFATTTGVNNSFVGVNAGICNTEGNCNSFFGVNAGFANTTGGSNSFFGLNAGRFLANGSTALTIATNSVFMGTDTRANDDNQSNQIVIGHQAIGNGSNTATIGNSSLTHLYFTGAKTISTTTNALTLATGGNNGNIILSPHGSGNVGIGTTSPAGKLEVITSVNKKIDFRDAAHDTLTDLTSAITFSRVDGNSALGALMGWNNGGIALSGREGIAFATGGAFNYTSTVERWRITNTGILQSNAAQTIQTSTGNLTLATAAGSGNINLTPNGTGSTFVITSNATAIPLIVSRNTNTNGDVVIHLNGSGTDSTRGARIVASRLDTGNSHTLSFWTSANSATPTERMRITSDGNVLIGTTSTLTEKLSVNGNLLVRNADTQDGIRLVGRAGGTTSRSISITPATLAASRTYTLPDAGANAAFVMTAGNQTIGGTKTFSSTIAGSIDGNAATATLVTGTIGQLQRHDIRTISPSSITAGRLQFGFTSLANNNTSPYADFLHLRSYTDSTGGNDNLVMFRKDVIGMRIYQQTFGSATAYSSFSDVILSTGNQTIGGVKTFSSQILTTAGSASLPGYAFSASTNTGMYLDGTANIRFSTGGSISFDMTTSSIVSYQPHEFSTGSATLPTITFRGDTNTGIYSSAADELAISTNGTQRLRITAGGAMALGNITPTNTAGRFEASNDIVAFSSSDIRFKDNVKQIETPTERLSELRGVSFDWIEMEEFHGNKGHDYGVIAQEVEKIFPEMVITRESGYKAVRYEKLIPVMIESIKELNDVVKSQSDLLNELVTRINLLESK
jgi:hypothetical protein